MFLRNWAQLTLNMTPAERALEPEIAALGERYRVQYPFFGLHCIVDFALLDRKLIIEVDGPSHNTPKAKIKDQARTRALVERGWNVVRVTNDEVFTNPAGALASAIASAERAKCLLSNSTNQVLEPGSESEIAIVAVPHPHLYDQPAKPILKRPKPRSKSTGRQKTLRS